MNILVAVDGSKYGKWATEWVACLPLATPMRLTALHVVDIVSLMAPLTPHPVVVWNQKFLQAESRRLITRGRRVGTETKKLMNSLDLKGRALLQRGLVVPTILKHAKKRDTLVVLGSRGLGPLDRVMLGSVSTQIVHQARCPVLVIKQPPRPLRRILLATDGSKTSQKAVHFLQRHILPLQMQAKQAAAVTEIVVMHVMPFLKYPELKAAVKQMVHHTAERLTDAGFRTREMPRLGDPAEEILGCAEREKVDLIAAGARGLGAVARFFLGSVSTKLVHHSPCSVLIIR